MAGKGPQTVDAYLSVLEPHQAHLLAEVRAAVHRVAPDLTERIAYQMPRFDYAGTYLYAGAWKAHLGLYPIFPSADAELEARLAPYRSGKDTVRFKYNQPLPIDLVEAIARARIAAT